MNERVVTPARFFGRAFVIDGTIIEPCSACGTPLFPYRRHVCIGLEDHILDYEIAEVLEEAA